MRIRVRLFVADEYRPLRQVPLWLWLMVAGALAAQIAFHLLYVPPPSVSKQNFSSPPSVTLMRALSFGAPELMSKWVVFRVQAFDNQGDISIPFKELNYDALGEWLDLATALDERAEYPHFLMSKVYTSVLDEERARTAVDWVWRQFKKDPDHRWEWMGHATNVAKYFLEDDELALQMARDARELTSPESGAPAWVRQMEVFFLENQNEFEAAVTILASQLEAGEIRDPHEFAFSVDRLRSMVEDMAARGEIKNKQEWDEKIEDIEKLLITFQKQFEN